MSADRPDAGLGLRIPCAPWCGCRGTGGQASVAEQRALRAQRLATQLERTAEYHMAALLYRVQPGSGRRAHACHTAADMLRRDRRAVRR